MTLPMEGLKNPKAAQLAPKIRRLGFALTFILLLTGWSPPVAVLEGQVFMLFENERGGPDFRPLMLTPNDVATACVRYRSGMVSYRLENIPQTFSLTCTIPTQRETSANRTKFYFFVVNHNSALSKIQVYGSNLAKNRWVEFSESDKASLMKSIRNSLQNDNLIEGPEEGQDAFGNWRRCKDEKDDNCYRK